MRKFNNIIITGGAGFIGSNFIRYLLKKENFKGRIINYDLLTYAGNKDNLKDIESEYSSDRYVFVKGDICNNEQLCLIFEEYGVEAIINFAAETHVDRSILGPGEFIRTNVIGTYTLLECARNFWKNKQDVLFHHISTDEVYGALGKEGYFYETTPYNPRSPYSASKASSDHLVKAYYHTYGLPITISNCSNNFGPYQFPEKLIPLMIINISRDKPLPVYGKGENVRDWLYVEDHCSGIWKVIQSGKIGESYNIGGDCELQNLKLVELICERTAKMLGKSADKVKNLITFVKDRPGHDFRYAINCDKIKTELGWKKSHTFEEALDSTIFWYLNNSSWIKNVESGEYKKWIDLNYNKR